MRLFKPNYFSIYRFTVKLLPLTFLCFSTADCGTKTTKEVLRTQNQVFDSEKAVNINLASAADLEKLPGIGAKRAAHIIEYREEFGNFRKPEHLLLVEGISDTRFRALHNSIKVK